MSGAGLCWREGNGEYCPSCFAWLRVRSARMFGISSMSIGKKYFLSAAPTKMILPIYGGPAPGNALVSIDVDAGWKVFATVKTVPSGYTLGDEQ
jgi:hypothetical protein